MATLITGAGLVGTAFAQFAVKRSESVVFFDPEPRHHFIQMKLGKATYKLVRKDVRDLPALISTIQEHHIDTVIHTAGLIGKRVADSLYNGFQVNLVGTLNVAEAVRLTGVKRLVHTSTFGVYDTRRETDQPIRETFPRGTGKPYGNTKVAKEVLLEAYHLQYGFELIMLRPASVFGLGHFWSGSGGGEKMQILLQGALEGKAAKIPQDQTMVNEYVYAKDVGKAIDLAATVPMPPEIHFNIGNGTITSFEELVEMVKKLVPNVQIEIAPGEAPLSKAQPLDISRAATYLGWKPAYSLEEALKDYLQDLSAANKEMHRLIFA